MNLPGTLSAIPAAVNVPAPEPRQPPQHCKPSPAAPAAPGSAFRRSPGRLSALRGVTLGVMCRADQPPTATGTMWSICNRNREPQRRPLCGSTLLQRPRRHTLRLTAAGTDRRPETRRFDAEALPTPRSREVFRAARAAGCSVALIAAQWKP